MIKALGEAKSRFLVAGLAVLAAAPGIVNGFVYDDEPIIARNPLVQNLGSLPDVWTSAYWPIGLLYRPLAVQLFAVEWAIGGGRPVVFHLVSLVLAAVTALLFWRLLRELISPVPALLAAALFAVHPVHVEITGNTVGQTELLASLFALLAVERYLAWRREGTIPAGRRMALAGLTLASILSKETGYVVPLLLVAAELTVVRARAQSAWRMRHAVPALLLQAFAIAAAVLLRIGVVGPSTAAGPGVAIRDLPAADRVLGMLAVVPQWVRLLLWPTHLQAEYGPPALELTRNLSPAHLLGAALLLCGIVMAATAWRRNPAAALGLVWIAVALLPVSNVFAPTGVILAERTLFLPSAGALLALGASLGPLLRMSSRGTRARQAALAIGAALVAAGTIRSMERQTVWRDQAGFFDRLVQDAPTTYRAHLVASVFYLDAQRPEDAERTARRGLELYTGDPQLYEHLGQILRRQRRCAEAIPILREGTRRFPDGTVVRSRYIECALAVGDTAAARATAEEALRLGRSEFEQTIRRLNKDSPPTARQVP